MDAETIEEIAKIECMKLEIEQGLNIKSCSEANYKEVEEILKNI